jgi:hypothetical protein
MPRPKARKAKARRRLTERQRRQANREYGKRYRATHRKEISARNKAYFKARPGFWKRWYAAHREERILYKRRWRKKQKLLLMRKQKQAQKKRR